MILETQRLILRAFEPDDAPFIVDLLNQPSFLRNIGDKGVRTLDDAIAYLRAGPLHSYAQHGYGLYLVRLRERDVPIGMCGLLKREALPDPDIGFAFLPDYWSRGFATESARAVLRHAREKLALERILAVASMDNHDSMRVLARIGLHPHGTVQLTTDGDLLRLFSTEAAPAPRAQPAVDRPEA